MRPNNRQKYRYTPSGVWHIGNMRRSWRRNDGFYS